MAKYDSRNWYFQCGLLGYYPIWLQQFANIKVFIIIYGLLGTLQATAYIYFVATLTTLEKRFKIPSRSIGIVLSGNETSQIMLSLIITYISGQRNRPYWIAWGVVLCGISCYILLIPHYLYGGGSDIELLTEEYLKDHNNNESYKLTIRKNDSKDYSSYQFCEKNSTYLDINNCESLTLAYVPLILIFLSQFVLGIGFTLYFALGQTYLDDNSKPTRSPINMAIAFSLRLIGPIIGFISAHAALNMFIEITKTPIIDKNDSRWLGAWWFGWIILGTIFMIFSILIGLFPKELHNGKLKNDLFVENCENKKRTVKVSYNLKEFSSTLGRLISNKTLIYNIFSSIFYILGTTPYVTFLSKYSEIQLQQYARNSTIIIGPISIIGLIIGTLISGFTISKYKPNSSKVLMWNVFVGAIYMLGQFSYTFLYCPQGIDSSMKSKFNLTTLCNSQCYCDEFPYTPVCHINSGITYYSPCHAGCSDWNPETNIYSNCTCLEFSLNSNNFQTDNNNWNEWEMNLENGKCFYDCFSIICTFTIISLTLNWLSSSGRIGNTLINYRIVNNEDKPFAQGLTLTLISLLASIPGPILFGNIIDSTCLVWTETCNGRGDCQLYDQTKFRYYVNFTAAVLTMFGVFFDILVWYHGRSTNLYENEHFDNRKKSRALQILLPNKTMETTTK